MTVTQMRGSMPRREEYPENWDEYIGQYSVKRQIRIAAQAARKRGKPMGHVFITGESGIGKTALAFLIAKELGKRMHIVSGRVTVDDARLVLARCEYGDVLFYDEIHGAVQNTRKGGDWMLHLLENGCLMGPQGPEQQPKITIVGATTNPQLLPKEVRGRFSHVAELSPYSDQEAVGIAGLMVTKLFQNIEPRPSDVNLIEIAFAASNKPRSIRSVVEHLADLALLGEVELGTDGYDVAEALEWSGLTPDGLTKLAVRYLLVLYNSPDLRAGRDTLKQALDEIDGLTEVEQLLVAKQMIARTGRGRQLTQKGIARVMEEVE